MITHWKFFLFAFMLIASTCFANDFSDKLSMKFQRKEIGRSELNKPIYAYFWGKGARKILIMGAKHGDEVNSSRMVYYLMQKIKKNEIIISEKITLIFIPVVNPDGFLYHSRLNSQGVDINRNFATKDWQPQIHVAGYQLPFGGGHKRGSEKETMHLMNFFREHKPTITISYHSRAGFIYPEMNDKHSIALSRIYSKASGIKALYVNWSQKYYPVTGGCSLWLFKELGLTSIVIEHKEKYTISMRELKQNWLGVKAMISYLTNQ